MTVIAKISAKGQTTIPAPIRAALRLSPGDLIAWELTDDGTALVHPVQTHEDEYLRALEGTLSEWASPADEQAYGAL